MQYLTKLLDKTSGIVDWTPLIAAILVFATYQYSERISDVVGPVSIHLRTCRPSVLAGSASASLLGSRSIPVRNRVCCGGRRDAFLLLADLWDPWTNCFWIAVHCDRNDSVILGQFAEHRLGDSNGSRGNRLPFTACLAFREQRDSRCPDRIFDDRRRRLVPSYSASGRASYGGFGGSGARTRAGRNQDRAASITIAASALRSCGGIVCRHDVFERTTRLGASAHDQGGAGQRQATGVERKFGAGNRLDRHPGCDLRACRTGIRESIAAIG